MKRSDFIPRAHARGMIRKAGIVLLLIAFLAAAICGCGKKIEPADDGTSRTVFLCFYANPDELPMLPGAEATFDFSRATVTENRGDFVKITVPASGVGENAGKTVNKTVDLLKIEGEWYLDNYPNVVFPKGEK